MEQETTTTAITPTGNDCERPTWFADDQCDDINNIAACYWDGGDCCNNDKPDWNKWCTDCQCLDPSVVGGGTTLPKCELPDWASLDWIADKYCDDVTNNAACNWDGGDCCNNDNPDWKKWCTVCE